MDDGYSAYSTQTQENPEQQTYEAPQEAMATTNTTSGVIWTESGNSLEFGTYSGKTFYKIAYFRRLNTRPSGDQEAIYMLQGATCDNGSPVEVTFNGASVKNNVIQAIRPGSVPTTTPTFETVTVACADNQLCVGPRYELRYPTTPYYQCETVNCVDNGTTISLQYVGYYKGITGQSIDRPKYELCNPSGNNGKYPERSCSSTTYDNLGSTGVTMPFINSTDISCSGTTPICKNISGRGYCVSSSTANLQEQNTPKYIPI